jgi:hypothetical protein
MKPEDQINQFIAEQCGWTSVELEDFSEPGNPCAFMTGVPPKGSARIAIPDYCNDLNAMHEAEKFLLPDDAMYSQRNFYANKLGSLTNNDNGRGWQPLSNDDCFPILHATARQRSEAFVYIYQNA